VDQKIKVNEKSTLVFNGKHTLQQKHFLLTYLLTYLSIMVLLSMLQ